MYVHIHNIYICTYINIYMYIQSLHAFRRAESRGWSLEGVGGPLGVPARHLGVPGGRWGIPFGPKQQVTKAPLFMCLPPGAFFGRRAPHCFSG